MIDPSWLAEILAGLVLATALYCAGRIASSLIGGRRVELDADLTHILMGIAMAGMFVTPLAILDTAAWTVVFGLVAAWYALRIVAENRRRDANGEGGQGRWSGLRHHSGHLISALAMLYMFLAIPAAPASSTAGMSMGSTSSMDAGSGMGAHVPTLALLFALSLFLYAVLVADTIPSAAPEARASAGSPAAPATDGWRAGGCGLGIGRGTLLAPRGSALCEVVMSVSMGVMLIAML